MQVAANDSTFPVRRSSRTSPLKLMGVGWGLTSALVGLFVICYLASFVWPATGLAHGWVRIFATQPENVVRSVVEGVVGSTGAAWLTAVLFVPVYNRVAGR